MISSKLNSTTQRSVQPANSARISRWLPVLASLVLAACANMPGDTPEQQVRTRATARWQALAAGDIASAYTYGTAGYKAVVTSDAYRRSVANGSWYGAEVLDVTCPEQTKCVAKVRIDFKYLGRKGGEKISTHTDETWLLEDGQWWFFQKI